MNKKHLWGVIVVLVISLAVLYFDLRKTPVQKLIQASQQINLVFLLLVFGAILFSYLCEAAILATLAYRSSEPHRSFWSYIRIPIIQALFNAITPMSTGGQPAQLTAMVEMGMEGGRATSLLLMKFILYQLVVLFAYVSAILSGFHLVMTKFAGLAFFIGVGFIIHISSIIFLLAIMFAYNWTKKATIFCFNLLASLIKTSKVEKWRRATLSKIDSFYQESQSLKKKKLKLVIAIGLTVLQLLAFYSIPFFILQTLGISCSWLSVTQMNIMIIMFMAIIPIPGASGGAEFSFQTLFSTFIANSSLLVLAMFLWRFATYFLGMILGIFGWSIKPQKIKS